MATNNLTGGIIDLPTSVQRGGGAIFGLATGYLLAGFLVCFLQTLPMHENFLGYQWRGDAESGPRRWFPPDRVWLAIMRRAGGYMLANDVDPEAGEIISDSFINGYKTFDKYSTFAIRYARHRRYGDNRDALPYANELNREIYRGTLPAPAP